MTAGGRVADAGIGFIGGILGGVAVFGRVAHDLDTIARLAEGNRPRRLPAIRHRHTSHRAGGYPLGDFGPRRADNAGPVLPPLVFGTWIGWQLYGRMNDLRFRQALAVLLIASGATLVF